MFHILFLRLHHDNNVSSIDKWGVGEDMGGVGGGGGSSKRQKEEFEILWFYNYSVLKKSFCKTLISQINF